MKIVREHLNEITKFDIQKGGSGWGAIGVGRKSLIKDWLDKNGITNYQINDDSTINVNGSVVLESELDEALPDYIQFNKVSADFIITGNNLLHLKGCPYEVGEDFDCSFNQIGTLDFCPKVVKNNFIMNDNLYRTFTPIEIKKKCKVGRGIYITVEEHFDATNTISVEDIPSARTKYIK
jgi:hypothetical protein